MPVEQPESEPRSIARACEIHARVTRAGMCGAALLPIALLSACAGVPGGTTPLAGGLGVLPASHALASLQPGAASTTAPPTADWPGGHWWQSYGDPQLAALISEALAHSPDIAVADARLAKAGAMSAMAASTMVPQLDGRASVGGTKQSYNLGFPPAFQAYLPHGWKREGELAASLGWDPDLWGRNRAALAAAHAERGAAAIDASAARLALAAAIANAYAGLAGDIAAQEAGKATLDNRANVEKLVGLRFDQGLENRTSLDTTRAGTASARAELAGAEARVGLRRNQLAALMGQGPDRGLTIAPPALAPLNSAALPADVTTDLLGHRPDIAAARARAQAAAARVRAARADFFPAIRLQGLAGYQSLGLGHLLSPASTFGTVGPALSLPIFHGGEIRGQYRGAHADYDLAVADYNRTVVAAYQQLADAAAMRAATIHQRDEAASAEADCAEAFRLTMARFAGGLAKGLDVLASQDRLIGARAALSAADTAARQADVALIRALGGGYASQHAIAATAPKDRP